MLVSLMLKIYIYAKTVSSAHVLDMFDIGSTDQSSHKVNPIRLPRTSFAAN